MDAPAWPHASFTAPFTARGRAALVPPPPWHYAGWLLNVAFRFDAALAAGWVPPVVGRATGRGCVHFADWQACTDGRELLDPVHAQYRETIVVLEVARADGQTAAYCPFIWVDQDVALVRGLLQGWPKKLGTTWLTRSLPLIHPAAAPVMAGSRLGASLAVKDRRLVEARATLTGAPGQPLGFLALPTVGAVGWPDLRAPHERPVPTFVRSAITGKVDAGWHAAEATLDFLPHPTEEVGALGGCAVDSASAGWLGLTVTGALDA